MSEVMEIGIKRWRVRRQSVLMLEITQSKASLAAASRQLNLTLGKIECWLQNRKRGMENILDHAGRRIRSIPAANERPTRSLWGGGAGDPRPKKAGLLPGKRRQLMLSVLQGIMKEGFMLPITKLSQ